MKRWIWILPVICCLLTCCTRQGHEITDPVTFYYPRVEPIYGQSDGLIAAQTRSADGDPLDYVYLLSQYLRGPQDAALISPFPKGIKLISLRVDGSTAHVTLSDGITSLGGMDLTLACSCLALTIGGLTQCDTVVIQAENGLLDGSRAIVMRPDSLLLYDSSAQPAE